MMIRPCPMRAWTSAKRTGAARCLCAARYAVLACLLALAAAVMLCPQGCGKGPSALPGLAITLTLESGTIQLSGGTTTAIASVTDGSLNPIANAAVLIRCQDSQGNPVAGVVGPVLNHFNGIYTATLANFPKPDTYTVIAATGQAKDSKPLKVVGPGGGRLVLTLEPSVVPVAQARTTAKVAAYDANEKPWPGLAVTITIEPSTGGLVGHVTDKGDGTYTADITQLTTPGTYTVTARAAGLEDSETLQVTSGPAVSLQGVVVANERDAKLTYTNIKDAPDTLTATTGRRPNGLAVTHTKDRLLVSNFSDATLRVFDIGADGALRARGADSAVGRGPRKVAITPDDAWAVTANFSADSISVVSLSSLQRFSSDIPVGKGPQAVAVTPEGSRVLVANGLDDTVSVLSFSAGTATKAQDPVPVGKNPIDIAVSPNGTRALVANFLDNTVSVLALEQGAVRRAQPDIPVGRNPRAVAVSPRGDIALVTNFRDATVAVLRIDAQGGVQKAQADVAVGSFPIDVTMAERAGALFAFVANHDTGTVSVLSIDAQGTVTNTGQAAALGLSPSAVASTY